MDHQTEEDIWGMRDTSRQNSVRLIASNPDMKNTNVVSCACGEWIDRANDWYVMIANGTLICRSCARCGSCGRECTTANRRLVCIDGLVLCHPCLERFGHYIEPPIRIKVEKPNEPLSPPDNANITPDNANNVDAMTECKRKDRNRFADKADKRQRIRAAYYDRPSAALPDSRNPLFTAPVYDARKGSLEKMACPGCSNVASGANRYVVPSMARVYHKPCFTCNSCKELVTEGTQVAGKHFEFCTCEPPLVWCTRNNCKKERIAHHMTGLCWLGSLRPGGREQRDTDISAQAARKAEATAKRASEAPDA